MKSTMDIVNGNGKKAGTKDIEKVAVLVGAIVGAVAILALLVFLLRGRPVKQVRQATLTVPEGQMAYALVLPDTSSGSAGIQAGSIIKLYHYDADAGTVSAPELEYVRVIGVDTTTETVSVEGTTQQQQKQILTLALSEQQTQKLIQLQNTYVLYVTMVSSGNEELATKLLQEQQDILTQMQEAQEQQKAEAAAAADEAARKAAEQKAAQEKAAQEKAAGKPVNGNSSAEKPAG